jgi:phage tail tape-measure protein
MSDERFKNDPSRTGTLEAEREHSEHPKVTGEPGSHKVGTGVGAAGGAAAGAAVGAAVGGPVGAVVGAAVGGISGAMAGKGIAAAFDPKVEDAYWRQGYSTRPYAKGRAYDELAPAYRYGGESAVAHQGKSFDTASQDLERGWDKARGTSRLAWHDAKEAVRDGWQRVEHNAKDPNYRSENR